ncbi:N-acetylglucosamine-6-phosphate deacetylase [Chytriomyces confervae]|uniref:N-acetylglucosamine-6-phosphate deacetylase n=1 Tax=Chytriomyces confervae TaxID=246404 RepID=A0A507FDP1_9FUNG|nr:N-acetylglucosamine-6-phosphate deacetylase [Chytriomyces confervae]
MLGSLFGRKEEHAGANNNAASRTQVLDHVSRSLSRQRPQSRNSGLLGWLASTQSQILARRVGRGGDATETHQREVLISLAFSVAPSNMMCFILNSLIVTVMLQSQPRTSSNWSAESPPTSPALRPISPQNFYDSPIRLAPATPHMLGARADENKYRMRLLTDRMFSPRDKHHIPLVSLGPSVFSDSSKSAEKVIQLLRCDVLKNGKIVRDETLWIQGNKIVDGATLFFAGVKPDQVIDLGGATAGQRRPLVVPGFIDVQINGYFGYDFAEQSKLEEGLDVVAKGLLKYGVTSFLPTVVSSLPQTYQEVLPIIDAKRGRRSGHAEIIGAHLEGPFIAPCKKGAHNIDYFRSAPNGFADLIECYGKYLDPSSSVQKDDNVVKIITVAPELEGMLGAIEGIKKEWGDKIAVSLGHTECNYEQAEKSVESGVTMITHLFNAMHPFYHREPGPMGVIGFSSLPRNTKKPFFGVIADGVHTSPSSIRVAYNAYPEGAMLVTDAMAGAGLDGDEFMLGSMHVERKGPMEVVIAGTNTLAGSVATMPFCIANLVKFAGCSLAEAVNAATITPAKSLGIYGKKGSLMPGADADFVILDQLSDVDESAFRVARVFFAGEEVFTVA